MPECESGLPNPPEIESQYPSGSVPEVRVSRCSALCTYGMTQLVMTGALKQSLAAHFSVADHILNATLRRSLSQRGMWRSTEPSAITIDPVAKWTPGDTGKLPALLLKENDWTWQRLGTGDRHGTHPMTGRMDFSGHWVGSHTIFALASEAAEAQMLAWEAMKFLLWFSSELSTQFELQRFVPVSIGSVAALKRHKEIYVVPLVVGYVVSESWSLQPDAPLLKRIEWRTSVFQSAY